jgi:hypothetical protein
MIVVSNTFAYDFNEFRQDVSKNYKQITEWVSGKFNAVFPKNENDIVSFLDAAYNTGKSVDKQIRKKLEGHDDILVRLDNMLYEPEDYSEFSGKTIICHGHTFLIQTDAKTGKLIAICHDDWGCPCTGHDKKKLDQFKAEYVQIMREAGLLDPRFKWSNKPLLANDSDCELY